MAIDLGNGQIDIFNNAGTIQDISCRYFDNYLNSKPSSLLQRFISHPRLCLSNLLRVDTIWVNLKVVRQKHFPLENNCAQHLNYPFAYYPSQFFWRTERSYYSYKRHYTKYLSLTALKLEDLTEKQIHFLKYLNQQLLDIQISVNRENIRLRAIMNATLKSKSHWLEDFEIDGNYHFLLAKSDKQHRPYRDSNILISLDRNMRSRKENKEVTIKELNEFNWNLAKDPGHPFWGDFHTRMFYELYEHSELNWINILRIGDIIVDHEIYYQVDF